MGKIWLRVVSGALVVTLLALTVASWKMIGTASGDKSEGLEKKPHIRYTKEEREAARKADWGSVDTAELRKEALEILGRLDELPNVLEIVEDAARLSEIFRLWGRVDFDEARRFLENEELAKKMVTHGSTYADRLYLACLIGYSRTDPVHAWGVFLTTQNKQERLTGLRSGDDVGTHDVPAEAIMRVLFKKSEKVALKLLRELDTEHSHLIAPSLRAIMSESDDAEFRAEIFKEFYETDSQADRLHAGLVCAGIAVHDPQMAWEFLSKASTGLRIEIHPELLLGMEFIGSLAQRQPEEALRFIAEFKHDEQQDLYQGALLMSFISTQFSYNPELIVKALEMDSLKRFQEEFFSDEIQSLESLDIPWPLIDENVPLSKEIHLERFQQAVESSKLPESLKERFLVAIEKKISVDKGK